LTGKNRRWTVRDLVEKYEEMLRKEWELLQAMRKIRRKLADVEDRVFGAVADGRQVSEDDAQEYSGLIVGLCELVFEYIELLDEQSALRGKMALEEYDGRASEEDLEEYHRVLRMYPWEIQQSETTNAEKGGS
jgi:hypothetical protein